MISSTTSGIVLTVNIIEPGLRYTIQNNVPTYVSNKSLLTLKGPIVPYIFSDNLALHKIDNLLVNITSVDVNGAVTGVSVTNLNKGLGYLSGQYVSIFKSEDFTDYCVLSIGYVS